MTQNRSKRHHYIPQFLIKNWANDTGKVWSYNKRTDCIFPSSPKNLFLENGLYTLMHGLNLEKSDEIEKLFAGQEERVAKIVDKILKNVRNGITPTLNELEFLELQTFMLAITRRTPAALKAFLAKNPNEFLLRETDRLMSDGHPAIDSDLTYNEAEVRKLERIVESNACAKFAAGDNPNLQQQVRQYCSDYGLEAFVLSNPRRSILHGSRRLFFSSGAFHRTKAFQSSQISNRTRRRTSVYTSFTQV
ncbi:MAG: DUF4238 domain-containing protein [Gammaproteobacteria bacterium]|nr:DUF4238 domain-containing protein [Gammaproteobacteria bacterium]